jgi:hypothetical protein
VRLLLLLGGSGHRVGLLWRCIRRAKSGSRSVVPNDNTF